MTYDEVTDASIWNDLVVSALDYTFLQSWEFGELQKELGHKIYRLKFNDDKGQTLLLASFLVVAAKRGTIMQFRHAPLLLTSEVSSTQWQEFLVQIQELAKQEACDLIRMQPLLLADAENAKSAAFIDALNYAEFADAPIHNIDAQKTLVLNIDRSDEELLTNMRKQTRYYVKRAEKDGIEVEKFSDGKNLVPISEFYKIHHDTTVRQKFTSFSESYYKKAYLAYNSLQGHITNAVRSEVYLAKFEGKYFAGGIFVFFGKKAFYSDGGSLTSYSKLPGSYLLQWNAIKRAKELGCVSYNFWGGVSPDQEDTKYPWYGIDLFKRGFGGDRVDYIHAQDKGLTWKYSLQKILETIERKRRGY